MVFKKDSNELTLSECASRLGISRQAVKKHIDAGRLKAEKRGKSWYVQTVHLHEFIRDNTTRNY